MANGAENKRARREQDEDFEIRDHISHQDCNDRAKNEEEALAKIKLADNLMYWDDAFISGFENLDEVVHNLLHQRTQFPSTESPFGTSILPFQARTIHEAIQEGSRNHKYFHFNFCTTTLPDAVGEFHCYLTQNNRNGIFHYSTNEPGSALSGPDLLYSGDYDLRFVPVIRYRGTKANGMDRILLALESGCQTMYHQKLPVGTVGYRYNEAGIPIKDQSTDRICTLYFVYSESKLLKKVEAGNLGIGPTKRGALNNPLFNFTLWDSSTWAPVEIP